MTCNYEARRRGLRKLQLITDARAICPDVVIVLGEELGRFRDASKVLYKFLESFTWSGKVERLGFDEVFMDVTDIVDYNQTLLNQNDLSHSFFQLKKDDPTNGFGFDATSISPHGYPSGGGEFPISPDHMLEVRLMVGSHLAEHLRMRLEEEKGYTATVGISTNKLLAKLVGNLNKPKGQTTLLPPYEDASVASNVTAFIDGHDIGKIPGIGFKTAQLIRNHVLSRPVDFDMGLIYGLTKESVLVGDVKLFPGMGPDILERVLGGPGTERGIGGKIWNLINGIDDTEVQQMKKVPSQISIEDSYVRLDTMAEVQKELRLLATSLIKRMHTDLLEEDDDPDAKASKVWTAIPKTVRLSTRPRPPLKRDGTRTRTFNRISRSCPLPGFIFGLKDGTDAVVEKLVLNTLIPLFKQLHPQSSGWNLSLMNICVTNLIETASGDTSGNGRDIGKMFKRQETVLKEWKIEDRDVPPEEPERCGHVEAEPSAGNEAQDEVMGSEDIMAQSQATIDDNGLWEDDDAEDMELERCMDCGALIPPFAREAHDRFHSLE